MNPRRWESNPRTRSAEKEPLSSHLHQIRAALLEETHRQTCSPLVPPKKSNLAAKSRRPNLQPAAAAPASVAVDRRMNQAERDREMPLLTLERSRRGADRRGRRGSGLYWFVSPRASVSCEWGKYSWRLTKMKWRFPNPILRLRG